MWVQLLVVRLEYRLKRHDRSGLLLLNRKFRKYVERNILSSVRGYAWLIIVDSRFYEWIYLTSLLQLHSVIRVHTHSAPSGYRIPLWVALLRSRKLVNSLPSRFSFRVLSYSVVCLLSKWHCDWRSVSQWVLVSSQIWGSWPDIYYCLTVLIFFLWSALS
jgi:hypothetical protein